VGSRSVEGSRVWFPTMSLSHFSLLLKPTFAFAVAKVVRADEHRLTEGTHLFFREGLEVFRVDACYVHDVDGPSTHHDATERSREYREARAGAGAASAHIMEAGVAPRVHPTASRGPSRGSVAEAFSVRVKE